mmetsp:Transcript_34772/g.82594  ORF Transcript_34772/g.82594 Transcript_34772/m.82594 type:complete len:271 (+) Transcript_34772:1802-2614(+)
MTTSRGPSSSRRRLRTRRASGTSPCKPSRPASRMPQGSSRRCGRSSSGSRRALGAFASMGSLFSRGTSCRRSRPWKIASRFSPREIAPRCCSPRIRSLRSGTGAVRCAGAGSRASSRARTSISWSATWSRRCRLRRKRTLTRSRRISRNCGPRRLTPKKRSRRRKRFQSAKKTSDGRSRIWRRTRGCTRPSRGPRRTRPTSTRRPLASRASWSSWTCPAWRGFARRSKVPGSTAPGGRTQSARRPLSCRSTTSTRSWTRFGGARASRRRC